MVGLDLMYGRQRSPDPLLMDMLWNSAHDVVGGWAWTGFVDEELDGLVGQLRAIADLEARCELAQQAQRIIMENALMLPTPSEPILYAVSDEVRDFELMSKGQFFFVHSARLVREKCIRSGLEILPMRRWLTSTSVAGESQSSCRAGKRSKSRSQRIPWAGAG